MMKTTEIEYTTCPHHGRYAASWLKGGVRYAVAGCPACIAEAKSKALFKVAAIPPRFENKRLDSYQPQNASQNRVKSFVTAFTGELNTYLAKGVSAVLYGPYGVGKTHLAVALAHEVLNSGKTARFTTVSGMLSEVRATYGGQGSELAVIRAFQNVDFLILDELGATAGTDSEARILTDVMNGRYDRMKSTFILSNLNLEQIERVLTPRILDRIREGGGKAFCVEGSSYRKLAAVGE